MHGDRIAESHSATLNEHLRGQIHDLEIKCEKLEKSMFRLQYENIKLRHYATSLEQDLARALASSPIENSKPEASQLKKIWDEIITDGIMDTFAPYISRRNTVASVVQALAWRIFDEIKEKKRNIVSSIGNMLKAKKAETEKCIGPLLSQNKNAIFEFLDEDLTRIQKSVAESLELVKRPFSKLFEVLKRDSAGHMLIRQLNQAATTVLFENPEYSFPAPCDTIVNYNKQSHYCVDGFVKEGMECLVVLPGPMGTKSAVLPYKQEEEQKVGSEVVIQLETSTCNKAVWKNNGAVSKRISTESCRTKSVDTRITKRNSEYLGKWNGVCKRTNYYN